jgi:hypothetical protein
MRHPTQASLMPPAQAEALYDIALERENNVNEPDETIDPADRIGSTGISLLLKKFATSTQSSEVAKNGQAPQTVLSENPALPPNVHQTSH